MFELVNIFDVFLPQLLLYPNAADPLNGEAAALYNSDKAAFSKRVKGDSVFVCLILLCASHKWEAEHVKLNASVDFSIGEEEEQEEEDQPMR